MSLKISVADPEQGTEGKAAPAPERKPRAESVGRKVLMRFDTDPTPLWIKNGKTVLEDQVLEQDIYIDDGVIKEMGDYLDIPCGTKTIDATGKYVFPGFIDPNTHLHQDSLDPPTKDDFFTGTRAAVAGGTTTIIDSVYPKKGESLVKKHEMYMKRAEGNVCCNFAFHCTIVEWNDEVKADMETLTKEHGVNSFEVYMARQSVLEDGDILEVCEECRKLGALPMVHAENNSIIERLTKRLMEAGVTGPDGHALASPAMFEGEAVHRAAVMASHAASPLYIMNVSSKPAVKRIMMCRDKYKVRIYGETLPCYVCFDSSVYLDEDYFKAASYVVSPPLRPDQNTGKCLLKWLGDDTLQLVASAHTTYSRDQKKPGQCDFPKIPSGVNGIEYRPAIMWEKGVHEENYDVPRFAHICSTNAAKLFNIYPKKGTLKEGSDADIVVWDPEKKVTASAKTHNLNIDYNIFEGMELHGYPEYVIINGLVCVDKFELKYVQGHGKYVPCVPFSPYIYKNTGSLLDCTCTGSKIP